MAKTMLNPRSELYGRRDNATRIGQTSIMNLFDETAKQLLRRTHTSALKTGLDAFDANRGLFPGEWVEIAGANGSGKTRLLMHVITHALTNVAQKIDRLDFNVFFHARLEDWKVECLY